jgi:translocation and assembly module TamB
MRRVLIIVGIFLLVLLAVPTIGVYWLCYTESGLHWIVGRAERLKTATLRLEGVEGTLASRVHVTRFTIDHPRARIVAENVDTQVTLRSLFLQTIHVRSVHAGSISVELRRRPPQLPKKPPRFMPQWLRLEAERMAVDSARLVLVNGVVIDAAPVRTNAVLTSGQLDVENAFIRTEAYELTGNTTVLAADPTGLRGRMRFVFQLPEQPRFDGLVTFDGDLDSLAIQAALDAPFEANLQGDATQLTTNWQWTAKSRVERFNLKPWQPQSKLGDFAAALNAKGSSAGFDVSGTIQPTAKELGLLDVSLKGNYAKKRLDAEDLVVKMRRGGAELHATGGFLFDGGPPTLDLRGRWAGFRWPLSGQAVVTSPGGTFTLAGPLPYTYTLDGTLNAPKAKAVTFTAAGSLDKSSVRADSLDARAMGGTLHADGQLSWAENNAWQVRLAARNVDTAQLHPAFPGRAGFRVEGSGHGFDPKGQWDLALSNLDGQVRQQLISGHARVRHEGRTYRVSDADIRYGGAHLAADGVYGPTRDLHVELLAEDLSRVLPELRGHVDLEADLAGDDKEPRLTTTLRAGGIEYTNYRLGNLTVDGNVDLSDTRSSQLKVAATELGLENRRLRSLRIDAQGRASDHQVTIAADAYNVAVELHTHGGYQPEVWRGVVDGFTVSSGSSKYALQSPTNVVLGRTQVRVEPFCVNGAQEKTCGHGEWAQNGPWVAEIQADNLPLRLLAAGMARSSEYSGLLAFDVHAGGHPGALWTGTFRANFTDGVFTYKRANGKTETVNIGTGRARLSAEPDHYLANMTLSAAEAAVVRAEIKAERKLGAGWRSLPIVGSLDAQTTQLGFVPLIVPQIDRAAGTLKADFTVGGTLGRPKFDGSLRLENGEADLYAINLLLRELNLQFDLSENTLRLNGSTRAGEGTATVTGDLAWQNAKPKGNLKFTGENLLLVDVPEAHILASPNLRFRVDGRRIDVDGAVRVPHARLAPANLTGARLPSEDEVIVGEEPKNPGGGFIVSTGIHMVLGDDVSIESYGLSGKLSGGVLTYSATGEISTGIGEIKIEEGKYVAYSRELDIELGRLVFTGGPLGDPGVDLRAVKRFPDVVAGVNVRGTLRQPRISFFSDPPLPQNQIVSILVAGRTLDSLQGDTAANAGPSRDQLLAQGGALLASRLGEQLGLQDVSVESDSANETSLVLGKYLSPRLYVSYGISLTESINTFKLRYTISDHWTLKTEAGENRAADLVYTIDR